MQEIENRLRTSLNPTVLELIDNSAAHRNHAGAKENPGAGHYNLTIVCEGFEGKNRIMRHRMVYDALGDLMKEAIHALQIDAKAPSEL